MVWTRPGYHQVFPYGTISLHRLLTSERISCPLFAAMLSVIASPGRGTSSFSLNTRLHPAWRIGRHADLMFILLYRSNTTCSTCVVPILSKYQLPQMQTLLMGVAGLGTVHSKAQPSTVMPTGCSAFRSSLRICSLFVNTYLLVVRISPLSANMAVGCGANLYEISLSVDTICLKDAVIPMTRAHMNSVFIF